MRGRGDGRKGGGGWDEKKEVRVEGLEEGGRFKGMGRRTAG